ncbi:MAG: hypothetical protein MJZ02_08445, partial [Paludibacteraceae bacterium]|nr:hypothetical protein [Paludibacteraceae bacterium]
MLYRKTNYFNHSEHNIFTKTHISDTLDVGQGKEKCTFLRKKSPILLHYEKNVLILQRNRGEQPPATHKIVPWCNGSTSVSGTACQG